MTNGVLTSSYLGAVFEANAIQAVLRNEGQGVQIFSLRSKVEDLKSKTIIFAADALLFFDASFEKEGSILVSGGINMEEDTSVLWLSRNSKWYHHPSRKSAT
jgi:hypothetical protein